MRLRDELELLRSRVSILGYSVAVILAVLAFGFWQLQVVQSSHYADLAAKNRIKDIRLVARRGTMYDRNGKVLADSRPSYNIIYVRENAPHTIDETVARIADGIGISKEVLTQNIKRKLKDPAYQPITLKADVGVADIAFVMAHALELPEISVEGQPRRQYPNGTLAAHVIGYVGEPNEEQLLNSPDLDPRDQVGIRGLEQVYDSVLRGKDGSRRVVVNNSGREIETLPDEVPPVPGNDLFTALDLDLQKAAEDMIGERTGAAVAVDPRTGEVLVLASKPEFDPNQFASGIPSSVFKALINDPNKPFTNRAIQMTQPPGSIFKVFEAAAALESETITPLDHFYCSGAATFNGRSFACWKDKGHGSISLYDAIRDSCDVYFYNVGKLLGIDKITKFVNVTGLGRKTGIDLPNEVEGVIPSEAYKLRAQKIKWNLIDTINASIGQGLIDFSPIQAAWAIGGLATGGHLKQPRLVEPEQLRKLGFESPDVKTEDYAIQEDTVATVRKAMWGVVNDGGTGKDARVVGFDVAGKTGTAQVVSAKSYKKGGENEDHAWFLGFAPYQNPEITIAVLIEHGGHGGEAAAPVAKAVLETYYKKKTSHSNDGTAEKVAAFMSKP